MRARLLVLLLSFNILSFAQTKDHVPVPGTKISLKPPPGFTPANSFTGFQNEAAGASIVITELPGPLKEVSKGFTQAGLQAQSMVLIAKDTVDISSGKASLYKISQRGLDSTIFYKQILVFGDDKKTILVNGIYPETSIVLEESIKTALLSASYNENQDANPLAAAKFLLDTKGTELKLTKFINGSLIYTTDGLMPTQAPGKLIFVGSASLNSIAVTDKKQFALDRLAQLPGIAPAVPKQTTAITIDGLQGFEITAEGVNEAGQKQLIYQVILYREDGGYYILFGSAGDKLIANLAVFKKIAKTFRQKK